MSKEINEILYGIDMQENSSGDGWWETSTGAEFGARKLSEITALFESQVREISALHEEIDRDHVSIKELRAQLDNIVNAIDEHMVVSHIGIFELGDDPKEALNKIACYEQSVGEYFGVQKFKELNHID